MFHVLLGQNASRHGRVEDALHAAFQQLVVLGLFVRVAAHAIAIVGNVLEPLPTFQGRLILGLGVTFGLLPIAILHRYVRAFRPWAFLTLHLWVVSQFPVEAMVFGSSGREVWLLYFVSHAFACFILVYDERKAIVSGGVTIVLMVAGLALDPARKAFATQASVTLLAVPLLSITEFFVSRFLRVLWLKDQRIRELAAQNENGLRMLSHDMANILSLARDSLEIAIEEIEELADGKPVDGGRAAVSKEGGEKPLSDALAYLEETRFSIAQGVGMLQAVRDYLAIFSGKKDPGIEEFPLADVLRDVVQLWQRPARKKHVSVALTCRVERGETVVRGSRPLFTHTIVGNLVSNAIKFSPAKSRILVTLRHDESRDELVIEVADQGDGIPDSRLRSLFETQGRTSSAGTKGERGTGFGLPLVRATLEMFGGRISIDSQGSRFTNADGSLVAGGTGTTFVCRIPRRRRSRAPQEAPSVKAS